MTDGRSARRTRGTNAVLDAVFELLQEGHVPPDVQQLSERSGVSVSSIFRYFDGLQDIQVQALARFHARFGELFEAPSSGPDLPAVPASERVVAFVDARLTLMDQVGLVLVVSRIRALENDALEESSSLVRAKLAQQVRDQFAPELARLTPAQRDALTAAVDSFCSPAAWTVLRDTHGRTSRQTRTTWTKGVAALLDAWIPDSDSAPKSDDTSKSDGAPKSERTV